jgi:DNA-binding MarR family transcriptional regulator
LLRAADKAFNTVLREELAAYGVTYSQFRHLWILWQTDGLPQAEISHNLGIGVAASTAVLESLSRQRLIRRERQSSDRRMIRVFLTRAGRALEPELTACAARVNLQAREGLSPHELAIMFETVGKVTRNMLKRRTVGAMLARPGERRVVSRSQAKGPKRR